MKINPDALEFIRQTLADAAAYRQTGDEHTRKADDFYRKAELLEATARGAQIALGIDGLPAADVAAHSGHRQPMPRRAGRQPGTVTSAGKEIMRAVHRLVGPRFTIEDYKAAADLAGHPQRRPSEILRKFEPYTAHGMLEKIDEGTFQITEDGLARFGIDGAMGSGAMPEPMQLGGGMVRGQVFPAASPEGSSPSTSTADPSDAPSLRARRSDDEADERQLWTTNPTIERRAGGT